MKRQLKYSPQQIREFLDYAKANDISMLKMINEKKINRRTFYMTMHRYGMNTDQTRKCEPFNTRAMTTEQVEEILKYAEAERISHKNACKHFGHSYNTFRGATIRLGIKAERFSSTYSEEDMKRFFDYTKANHLSKTKACDQLGYKYSLISSSAKRYGIVFDRDLVIFDEAKVLPEKEFVHFYQAKGYVAAEIHKASIKSGREISRQMVYYYCKEQSKERIQAKIDKLRQRLGHSESSQEAKV
jgi:hypothetical protein